MRYLVIAALIAVLPMLGFAQQSGTRTDHRDDVKILGIQVDQAVAVGLGVIGGAIGLHILLGGGSATLVGALAGALVGNWWYEQRSRGETPMMSVNYSAR